MSRRSRAAGVRIHAIHAQRDVLPRGEPGQQIRRLEHHAAIRAGAGDLAAIEHDAAVGDIGEAGAPSTAPWTCRSPNGRSAKRTRRAAMSSWKPSTTVSGPRGVGIDLVDVVELDVLVGVRQRLRLVGRAHGLRHEVRRGDRHDVGQLDARLRPAPASRAPTSSRYCVIVRAQLAVLRIVVHGLAIARPRQVHAGTPARASRADRASAE